MYKLQKLWGGLVKASKAKWIYQSLLNIQSLALQQMDTHLESCESGLMHQLQKIVNKINGHKVGYFGETIDSCIVGQKTFNGVT